MNPLSIATSGLITPAAVVSGGGTIDVAALSQQLVADLDAALTTAHGSGSWQRGIAGSYTLPVMQASVYTAVATATQKVRIVQGDTPTITFDLGADYTGWDAWFGARGRDGEYAMPPRLVQWADDGLGQGAISLTTTDTAADGTFAAEIELRKAGQILTAMKYGIVVLPQVI
jgi:hypothetical protein